MTHFRQQTTPWGRAGWAVYLIYESGVRRLAATAVAESKAGAKRMAAAYVLKALLEVWRTRVPMLGGPAPKG